ncbi:MAG: DUF542 domain-containing protein [Candidatus Hydrothermarchaeota archaeon]
MEITEKMTVAETIRRYPKSKSVLLRHGICDCCGGNITIERAARIRDLNIDEFMKELRGAIE